jgi:hypothetical protein
MAIGAALMLATLAQSFTFAVLGHTRGGPDDGMLPTARYEELVREVRSAQPDFVVLTGDLVYGDFHSPKVDRAAVLRDWEAVDAVFAELGVPIHRVPGNHDLWESVTRDLWIERYGALQKSFEYEGSLFLLLNSCWTPAAGDASHCPPKYIRGVQLDEARRAFLSKELAAHPQSSHVFAFLGHVLWWEEDAAWWSEVHPLLTESPTRAVFSGDLGPWKFSHQRRDDIDYLQTSCEFVPAPLEMQRNRESIRVLSEQLDTWAFVTVDGPSIDIDVRTLGALESGSFSPEKYRAVHEFDADTLERKVFRRMDNPTKLTDWLWKLGIAAACGGALIGAAAVWFLRRRR